MDDVLEVGLCKAPPGQDQWPTSISIVEPVMSKSVIWLRISYLGAPPPTSVDLNLRFNIKDVTGHPTAELFVGNTRVSPPGRIQIAPGTLAFTLLHINSVAAADGKGQYLDIILRVCGTTTDVEGTFNFNEVSGDLIL